MFNGGGWGMGFGGPIMLIFWLLVVIAIVVFVKWLSAQASPPQSRDRSPLEVLQDRYARGEISREEYEEKRRDLDRTG
jgi:putative membrane protein